jgi:hypothetical protein
MSDSYPYRMWHLAALPGVGATLAAAISQYRDMWRVTPNEILAHPAEAESVQRFTDVPVTADGAVLAKHIMIRYRKAALA